MQHCCPTFAFKPPIAHFVFPLLHPHHRLMPLAVFLRLLLPLHPLTPSGFFNGMLEATEPGAQKHFLSSHPVDIICIQKSNLNLYSSFLISGFSTLLSDCTHSRSGTLSRDVMHASGGVIIFARQDLSFSKLSTSLSSLDPYSDYVEVNISLNNFSLPFLNVYAPPIHSSATYSKTHSFSPSILSSSRNRTQPPWRGSIRFGHLL